MRAIEFINETDSFTPPSLSTGDTVLIGKFKNRKAEITGFTQDKHNQPVLKTNKGEVQLFKPRISKLMPEGVAEGLEHYDGIEISMEKEDDEIMVKAMMSGGRELGHVLFVIDGEYLAPQDLEVDERYQGQGIAATMYDYVKSKGYKIRRSGQQTDAGAGFWDKHKPGKNVWEQGVAEEVNPDVTSDEYFIEPTENVRMGDFVFNARTFSGGLGDPNARGLQIRAYDPKNLKGSIGSADFIVKKDKKGNTWLESDDTEVDELYRGKGVAAMMYAFAKSLGNDIKDSPYKSKAGSDMWKKWGSDAKHLVGQPGVPEDLTETTSQLGPQLYAPHPKNLDESMKPENVLWTSTASGNNNGYTSAWVRWAKNEMPGWIGHSGFLYDVSPSARILTINSDRDAMRVAKEYGLRTTDIMDLFRYMPWNKIAKDYDAIHHVPSNRGSDIFMYAWDVESTAWFNTKMLLNKRKVPIVASKQGMAE